MIPTIVLSDKKLGLGGRGFSEVDYKPRERKTARAILFNNNGCINVQFLQNLGIHKLPGGGVKQDETIEQALEREILEEVGCLYSSHRLFATVIEDRVKGKLFQISHCFIAKVSGVIGTPIIDEKEVSEGQVNFWLPPEEVFAKMKNEQVVLASQPENYRERFVNARELFFLGEFLKNHYKN